jgi:hypothetical protein
MSYIIFAAIIVMIGVFTYSVHRDGRPADSLLTYSSFYLLGVLGGLLHWALRMPDSPAWPWLVFGSVVSGPLVCLMWYFGHVRYWRKRKAAEQNGQSLINEEHP